MSYFKDKDCTEAYQYKKGENVTYSIDEEEATKMNNDCNVLTTPERVQLEPLVPGYKYDPSSMSVTCSTSNMETKLFQGKECKGEPVATLTVEWNKCSPVKKDERRWILVTGAEALAATAAAAVAFVATQF